MTWMKKEIDAAKTKELSEQYGIDMIMASILMRRDITKPQDLQFFLEDDIRFLHNPFLFKDMEKAVERIRKAVSDREKILIYGDRDVDGITSTVLLVESLSARNVSVEWKVPLGDDDYGLSMTDVDDAHHSGVTLLVTVDCGISNIREIEYANSKGMDVIIIDHHNPQPDLPAAFAIINPKVDDSGYPFRNLCGCGVASKVDWALAFSGSAYYGRPFVLLQVTPLHDSYAIEAVILGNLAERARFRENVVPGMGTSVYEKLANFINGSEIYLFDAGEQDKLIEKAFGPVARGLVFSDFQSLVRETFPALAGKSLLKIRELSRMGKYLGKNFSEIELFKNLFISAVLKKEKELFAGNLRRLDLAALGTIADLMPLLNENRIIVRQGLAIMASFERNGLRELLVKKNLLGKEISVKDIAWQISPIINASGRLGEPDKAVQLLLATEREKLEELSLYIFKLNEKRRELGETAWKKMLAQADDSFKKTAGKFVLISNSAIHRGITGILATKMVNYYKVPVCVIAELPHKAVGSLRSIREFPLAPFLLKFKDLFNDYGGHDMAAGFNLSLERLPSFRERFYDYAQGIILPEEKEEYIHVDAEIPLAYLTPELYKIVERLMPYGEAHPPLLFYSAGLVVESCDIVGKKEQVHLKMLLNTGKYKFPAMLWNGVDIYGERFKVGDKVDVIYRMQKNIYMNTETLQFIVRDIAMTKQKEVKTLHPDESFFDPSGISDF
jgi:single-stranded-DNA-specific exonuclease